MATMATCRCTYTKGRDTEAEIRDIENAGIAEDMGKIENLT